MLTVQEIFIKMSIFSVIFKLKKECKFYHCKLYSNLIDFSSGIIIVVLSMFLLEFGTTPTILALFPRSLLTELKLKLEKRGRRSTYKIFATK